MARRKRARDKQKESERKKEGERQLKNRGTGRSAEYVISQDRKDGGVLFRPLETAHIYYTYLCPQPVLEWPTEA